MRFINGGKAHVLNAAKPKQMQKWYNCDVKPARAGLGDWLMLVVSFSLTSRVVPEVLKGEGYGPL